ncbi:GNAT family N-acetyltransferase [Streptomyces ficellus]|uniref:GNAT family N-acetyltransferase n=1 Tax=Streptomyces ficellus TaxID=1977088 RepID=A0A6I6FKF2_9ACTN|nr:GNAT family N-acetyltransferase [Streptomyces ficellus]QGV79319.1 GNAT family N-acetyltransferase [Streptomyces ficellus]
MTRTAPTAAPGTAVDADTAVGSGTAAGPGAAPGDGPGAAVWDVGVCRDGEAFGRLARDWTGLYRRCATATPFQSHPWLHSWWVSYGTPGRLRVVLVRRNGRLVAAAPLRLERVPLPVLTPLGGAITDFSDVLVDDAHADEAVPVLAEALRRLARTAVIDLREVRAEAAAQRVYACWRGPRRRLPDSVCMELPALSIDGLVGRLPSSRAQRARSKLRKLDRLGIETHVVPPAEVPQALRRLLDLHQRQWADRGVTPEHLRPRFAEHLQRAVRPMVESGDAMVTEFRLAGDVVAADLTLMSPLLSGGYLYGADPVLRAGKVDVATLLLRNGARESSAGGRTTLSLLRGREPYKSHWRPEPVVNQRLLLARRRTAAPLLLLAGCAAGRRWAADRLRDRAWVRRLRS